MEAVYVKRLQDREAFLFEAYSRQSLAHDKALMTLSTAMFAFSVGYVQYLTDHAIRLTGLLIASWVLLGITLVSVLTSFIASQKACELQINFTDKLLASPEEDPAQPSTR